jgi:hypothetical protein
MARHDSDSSRDPERKRNGGADTPKREGSGSGIYNGQRDKATAWTPRRGRSGYGLESIRPHLRAQLEQQKLLRPTFPPDDDEPEWHK